MSIKPAMFLTSALVGTSLIATSVSAQAGGMTHMGTWGGEAGNGAMINGLSCDMPIFVPHPAVTVAPVQMNHPNMGNFGFNRANTPAPANVQGNVQGNVPASAPRAAYFGGTAPLNVQRMGGGNNNYGGGNRDAGGSNFGRNHPIAVCPSSKHLGQSRA